jgi:hypothetical protein
VRGAVFPLLLLLAACGGPRPPAPPPEDRLLRQSADAGRLALEAGRAEEAERQYRNALARARQGDSAVAIGATATGIAAALLDRNRPREALEEVEGAVAELRRRGVEPPPSLLLAGALARYRLNDASGAEAAAGAVLARGSEDAEAAHRAMFLRGLVAAGRRDAEAVAAARLALAGAGPAGFRADAEELAAREALLRGEAAAAEAAAGRAAVLRNEALDFRGVSRALAIAAEAAEGQGARARAADLYVRAGRAAFARGEPEGRLWLIRAEALAREAGDRALADAARAAARPPAE